MLSSTPTPAFSVTSSNVPSPAVAIEAVRQARGLADIEIVETVVVVVSRGDAVVAVDIDADGSIENGSPVIGAVQQLRALGFDSGECVRGHVDKGGAVCAADCLFAGFPLVAFHAPDSSRVHSVCQEPTRSSRCLLRKLADKVITNVGENRKRAAVRFADAVDFEFRRFDSRDFAQPLADTCDESASRPAMRSEANCRFSMSMPISGARRRFAGRDIASRRWMDASSDCAKCGVVAWRCLQVVAPLPAGSLRFRPRTSPWCSRPTPAPPARECQPGVKAKDNAASGERPETREGDRRRRPVAGDRRDAQEGRRPEHKGSNRDVFQDGPPGNGAVWLWEYNVMMEGNRRGRAGCPQS